MLKIASAVCPQLSRVIAYQPLYAINKARKWCTIKKSGKYIKRATIDQERRKTAVKNQQGRDRENREKEINVQVKTTLTSTRGTTCNSGGKATGWESRAAMST